MISRPYTYPYWTNGPGPGVVQPPSELSNTGWADGQAPEAENVNWQFWEINQWIEYLDQLTVSGIPNASIRLINGGNWSFNASTGALSWSATANLAIPSIPDSANAIAPGSVTMADGDIAYCVINPPIQATADSMQFSNMLTAINFTGNIQIGMTVTGPGIPGGTTVLGVSANSVTLSANATSTNTNANYVFNATGPITVVDESNLSLLPSIDAILLARRAGNVVYLGVNCSQMVLRDGEFKTLIGSGYFSLYQAPAGQNLTAGQLVYISPGVSDGGRTAGALYPLDVSAPNQAVRGTYAGVVITNVSTSGTATVLYSGFFLGSGLTPGVNYYADPSTPGGYTSIVPSGAGQRIVPVGFAVTSTIILFTGVASGAGSQGFPVFFEGSLGTGNGTQTTFALPSLPLNMNSLFVYVDGLIVPSSQWALSSQNLVFNTAPSTGQDIYVSYVLAQQSYIAAFQEKPTNSGDNLNFNLSGNPISQASTYVFIDGVILPSTQWSLTLSGGGSKITLNSALQPGQDIYTAYFTPASTGGSGLVTGGNNLGAGHPIFAGVLSGIMQFKTILPGSNVSITETSNDVTINAPGAGGIETHGSAATPVSINPASGLTPTSSLDQVWWVQPSSGSGAVNVTANPPIAAGTTVGQRLKIKSVASANYLVFPNVSGVDMDGNVDMGPYAQSIELTWDGTNWSEDSRRV